MIFFKPKAIIINAKCFLIKTLGQLIRPVYNFILAAYKFVENNKKMPISRCITIICKTGPMYKFPNKMHTKIADNNPKTKIYPSIKAFKMRIADIYK